VACLVLTPGGRTGWCEGPGATASQRSRRDQFHSQETHNTRFIHRRFIIQRGHEHSHLVDELVGVNRCDGVSKVTSSSVPFTRNTQHQFYSHLVDELVGVKAQVRRRLEADVEPQRRLAAETGARGEGNDGHLYAYRM